MESEKKLSTDLPQKNIDPMAFFEKNADFALSFKKTEKLASAIYMVTNLFSEHEPMKWTLRRKVSELLSFNLTYNDIQESNRLEFIHIVKSKILEITSLLEVAFRGGLISEMNFSILKQEFSNLNDLIDQVNSVPKTPRVDVLNPTFFELANTDRDLRYEQTEKNSLQSYERNGVQKISLPDSNSAIKDKQIIKDKGDFKRSNRQNIILNLLKKKKEVTIKDIAQVIKDCSEKTIQRELISFMEAGVLKRTGERRWSKYSLA